MLCVIVITPIINLVCELFSFPVALIKNTPATATLGRESFFFSQSLNTQSFMTKKAQQEEREAASDIVPRVRKQGILSPLSHLVLPFMQSRTLHSLFITPMLFHVIQLQSPVSYQRYVYATKEILRNLLGQRKLIRRATS